MTECVLPAIDMDLSVDCIPCEGASTALSKGDERGLERTAETVGSSSCGSLPELCTRAWTCSRKARIEVLGGH